MKTKFFSKENNYKFLWYIAGAVVIGLLTSSARNINEIKDSARLGKQAYEHNIQQDIKLANHETRIVELEKVSLVIIERLDNVCEGLNKLDKKLDNIYYSK